MPSQVLRRVCAATPIHPFAVGIEFARNELRGFRVDHASDVGKEIVRGEKCLGAKARVGEID